MKAKTLVLLALILAVLGGLVYMKNKPATKTTSIADPQPGESVLGSFDINEVAQIEIQTTTTVAMVVREKDKWAVPALYHYPADFSIVAEQLRALVDLTVGQVVRGGADIPADFGLEENSLKIVLSDKNGQRLKTVTLGAPREGQGQYIRIDDGPVLLVANNLSGFPQSDDGWIDKKIFEVKSQDVVQAKLRDTTIDAKEPNDYVLSDLKEDETVDHGAVRRLLNAFRRLECETIADPMLKSEELGFTNGPALMLTTKNGFSYTAIMGNPTSDPAKRYARFSVAYEQQTTNEVEIAQNTAQANAENNRLKDWTYVIDDMASRNILVERKDLIQKEEKQKPEEKTEDPAKPKPAKRKTSEANKEE